MKCIRLPALALLLGGLLLACPAASAQSPGQPLPSGAPPRPGQTSATATPAAPSAAGESYLGLPCEATRKVCAPESKKNTKVVYNSRCQEYCLPHCGSLLGMIHGG